ncbi:MAG TPA: methyltransferase domain-containing protein [Stellaceae bacterium]|nr:methyltransferase domain-containing protein [Stellaceae bacterium]
MTDGTASTLEEPLLRLFQELGIAQAHIAAREDTDWRGLASAHPERVASLSLLCPLVLDSRGLAGLTSRILVITGDRGNAAQRVLQAVEIIKGASKVALHDYESLMWSDLAADRAAEIGSALLDFLGRIDRERSLPAARLSEGEGEIAGISYRIRGAGPPLLLLPLLLAPSQWAPLIPALGERYCTIELGGAFLGIVGMLEMRGRSAYLGMIRTLLDIVEIKPGEVVLDVGCGSGVVIREVARRSMGANRLLGVDVSPYLVGEARRLARREEYGDRIAFHEGRAETLPFPDENVDVALSSTVLEEGDADRMLSEMLRVTKPGGRVGIVVRAVDIPAWVNLPLSGGTKSKLEAPGLFGAGVVPGGCADADLYRRFRAAGLTRLRFFPQLTAVTPEDPRFRIFRQQALAVLGGEEIPEWQNAVAQAEAEGTAFIAMPHHCAVGTKPR